MATEGTNQRTIWLVLAKLTRLFRLNTGKAWVSSLGPAGIVKLADGSVIVKAARPISMGLSSPTGQPIVGASDLIGWTPVVITPEMVGRTVAVFTSMEIKASKGWKITEEQENWRHQVDKAGGIAGIVNSDDAALNIIEQWYCKPCK